jgi:hypothetical protein
MIAMLTPRPSIGFGKPGWKNVRAISPRVAMWLVSRCNRQGTSASTLVTPVARETARI